MARKKSATARRREGMAGGTPVRALVMPLALSSDQHAMYMEAAKLYNRMWGSIVSWYDAHHTVNTIAAHKALYYNLRAKYPNCPRSSCATPCATPRARYARGTRAIRGASGRLGHPGGNRPSGSTRRP